MFQRGGFDGIIGNPPFLAGTKIRSTHGGAYRSFLVETVADGKAGRADLCVYFFLRAASLLMPRGAMGLVATSSIATGDSRAVGLEQLVERGLVIFRAVSSATWPGPASVEISICWLARTWFANAILDGEPVKRITPGLDPVYRVDGVPQRLEANSGRCYLGVYVHGEGFLLSPAEAAVLEEDDDSVATFIKPYVGGAEVNALADYAHPPRFVIDVGEMPLERLKEYPDLYRILDQRVRPVRQKKDENRYPRLVYEWWKFWNPRPELARRMAGLSRVIVMAKVSNLQVPRLTQTGPVFNDKVIVFASDSLFLYGVLTSSAHFWWTAKYATRMRLDPSYGPSDVFETFPLPNASDDVGEAIKLLHAAREKLMEARGVGLGQIYASVNDDAEDDRRISGLREHHMTLDRAVFSAYGLGHLEPDRAFENTEWGRRWVLRREVRQRMLEGLLELNLRRYVDEATELGVRLVEDSDGILVLERL